MRTDIRRFPKKVREEVLMDPVRMATYQAHIAKVAREGWFEMPGNEGKGIWDIEPPKDMRPADKDEKRPRSRSPARNKKSRSRSPPKREQELDKMQTEDRMIAESRQRIEARRRALEEAQKLRDRALKEQAKESERARRVDILLKAFEEERELERREREVKEEARAAEEIAAAQRKHADEQTNKLKNEERERERELERRERQMKEETRAAEEIAAAQRRHVEEQTSKLKNEERKEKEARRERQAQSATGGRAQNDKSGEERRHPNVQPNTRHRGDRPVAREESIRDNRDRRGSEGRTSPRRDKSHRERRSERPDKTHSRGREERRKESREHDKGDKDREQNLDSKPVDEQRPEPAPVGERKEATREGESQDEFKLVWKDREKIPIDEHLVLTECTGSDVYEIRSSDDESYPATLGAKDWTSKEMRDRFKNKLFHYEADPKSGCLNHLGEAGTQINNDGWYGPEQRRCAMIGGHKMMGVGETFQMGLDGTTIDIKVDWDQHDGHFENVKTAMEIMDKELKMRLDNRYGPWAVIERTKGGTVTPRATVTNYDADETRVVSVVMSGKLAITFYDALTGAPMEFEAKRGTVFVYDRDIPRSTRAISESNVEMTIRFLRKKRTYPSFWPPL